MANILTHDEIEALLKGLGGDEVETETDGSGRAGNIAPYDLSSQGRVTGDRMPTLDAINKRFARFFHKSMSAALRKAVDISVFSIEMIKFGDFMGTLPIPASLHIFKASPLKGLAVMAIESKLLFNLLDSFFGGSGRNYLLEQGRGFTSIESRLAAKVAQMALEDLEKAWAPAHPLRLSYVRGESSPQFAVVASPFEMAIIIKFEVKLEKSAGTLTVCLPYSAVKAVHHKLYAGFQGSQAEEDAAWISHFSQRARETEVSLKVELGRAVISAEKVMNLAKGDVIVLRHNVKEPLEVQVEGVPKFKAFTETSGGWKAVRVVGGIHPKQWKD